MKSGPGGSELLTGNEVFVKGSAKDPYILRAHNDGSYFSCSCPAWRNQGGNVDHRTCKHLTNELGAEFESARMGQVVVAAAAKGPSKAPPVILAESWDGVSDPTGMLLSEKLDGVRAYWDGKQFLSRQGNVFAAPSWFSNGLPSTTLDGELWIGRGKFQRTVSIVRTGSGDRGWEDVSFVLFDAPDVPGGFEERIAYLKENSASWNNKYVQVLEHSVCSGIEDVQRRLDELEEQGGEGLMLRAPGSAYTSGRTSDLLKAKRFKDAEARVVDVEAGKGRHAGRVGALVCELSDGTKFKIGTGLSDAERESPPPIGSLVTFRYQELTDAGVPRFPAFVRVRTDGAPLQLLTANNPAAETEVVSNKQGTLTSGELSPEAAVADRYEFVEGVSSKFWEVSVHACTVTTTWGRIGTAGQSSSKTYASSEMAKATATKQAAEKQDKGYIKR
jgi:DNA ligase 1